MGDGGHYEGALVPRYWSVGHGSRTARGQAASSQGALAYHVLDTMIAIAESVESRAFVEVESSVDKPPLLPEDWDPKERTI
jgi:hypothetical protein